MKVPPESFQVGIWALYFIFLLVGVYGLVAEWRRVKSTGGLPAGTLKPWTADVGEVFTFLGVWLLSFLVLPQIGFKIAGLAYPEVNLAANPVYAVGFYQREGFRVASEEFLEDGIPHVQMMLEF